MQEMSAMWLSKAGIEVQNTLFSIVSFVVPLTTIAEVNKAVHVHAY